MAIPYSEEFISNRNIPGDFRIPEPLEQYKTRGVFQQEHPSWFIPSFSKGVQGGFQEHRIWSG